MIRYVIERSGGVLAHVEKRQDGRVWKMSLSPRHDLARHSYEFEYGYGGSGPAQLALAILADAFRRLYGAGRQADDAALDAYQEFKWAVIASKTEPRWTVDLETVLHWLVDHGAADPALARENVVRAKESYEDEAVCCGQTNFVYRNVPENATRIPGELAEAKAAVARKREAYREAIECYRAVGGEWEDDL